MKNIWKWVRFVFLILYLLFIVVFIPLLGVIMYGTLTNTQLVTNSEAVNSIALIIGMLSLPGLIVQLVSIIDINKKRNYTLTCKCPNCRQLVDMKMKED